MNFSLNQLKDPAFDLSEAGGGMGLNIGPDGVPGAAMDPEQKQQVPFPPLTICSKQEVSQRN
jgi:hypothetical protein